MFLAPRPADRDAHRRLGRALAARPADRCCGARAATCPSSIRLPLDCGRHLLACGAELKNTFALAKGGRAWVGHHIGDLEELRDAALVREGIDHFQRLFAVEPEVVAHDLHPEYLSTKHALERDGRRAWWACSTTTRTWRRASPSTARRGPARGRDLRRHGLRRATARSGEASCCSATSRGFERAGPAVPGAHAGRRGGDPPAVADGVRVARRGARRAAARRRRAARQVAAEPGARCAELARSGSLRR